MMIHYCQIMTTFDIETENLLYERGKSRDKDAAHK